MKDNSPAGAGPLELGQPIPSATHPAVMNLRACQRQLDMDGCEVGVSRQALDETLALLDDLVAALRKIANGYWIGSDGKKYTIAEPSSVEQKIARAAIAKAEGRAAEDAQPSNERGEADRRP